MINYDKFEEQEMKGRMIELVKSAQDILLLFIKTLLTFIFFPSRADDINYRCDLLLFQQTRLSGQKEM